MAYSIHYYRLPGITNTNFLGAMVMNKTIPYQTYIFLLLFILLPMLGHAKTEVVTIRISGMSCELCIHKIKKQLLKTPEIKRVIIRWQLGRAQIHMHENKPVEIDKINKAILDAGYHPGEYTITQLD